MSKSAFGVVHKADSTKHAAEVGAGVAGLAGAASANRVINVAQDKRAKTWQKRRDKLHSVYGLDEQGKPVTNPKNTYRGQRSPKVKADAKASVKRKWTAINELNVKAKKDPIRRIGFRGRSAAVATGLVGGGGLLWHGARSLQEDVNKKANDVDYAATGGILGAAGYQGALYSTKPLNRRWEKKIATEGHPKDVGRLRKHRKDSGVPKNAQAGHPAWEKYYRNYPKDLPGAKFNRAMSYAHSGKTGVAATYGVAGAGALGALALKNKKDKVEKSLPKAVVLRRLEQPNQLKWGKKIKAWKKDQTVKKSSYFRNGQRVYRSISEMRPGQRNALRQQFKTAKQNKKSRRSLFERDNDSKVLHDFATGRPLEGTSVKSASSKEVSRFMSGFKRVAPHGPQTVNYHPFIQNDSGGVLAGAVTMHGGKTRVVVSGLGNHKSVGAHEAAHYTTKRSTRRGKQRNVVSLLSRTQRNPLALAREEARADGTAARLGYKIDGKSAYSSRNETPFTPEQYSEYMRVRNNMRSPIPNKQAKPFAMGSGGRRRVWAMPGRSKAE